MNLGRYTTNRFTQNNGNDEDLWLSPIWEAVGSGFLTRTIFIDLYHHEKWLPWTPTYENNHENIYQDLHNKKNTLNKTQMPTLHFIST